MRYTKFLKSFDLTATIGNTELPSKLRGDQCLLNCIEQLGGKTFDNGLYRIYQGDNVPVATSLLEAIFPELAGNFIVFGYDWLGRHFAVDSRRIDSGKKLVLMLEPGAGEVMQIPATIEAFHNEELVEYSDDALARNFYDQWRVRNDQPLGSSSCVGYKVPLFLGGSDTLDNLEICDLSAYLRICGALRTNTASLPDGQTINEIILNEGD